MFAAELLNLVQRFFLFTLELFSTLFRHLNFRFRGNDEAGYIITIGFKKWFAKAIGIY